MTKSEQLSMLHFLTSQLSVRILFKVLVILCVCGVAINNVRR